MTNIFLLILCMGAVTYLPRFLPLFFLSRKQLPPWLTTWLDFIPVAILSSLILPALVTGGSPRHLDIVKPELAAAVPTLIFALKTRSLGGTVVVGMGIYWLAQRIFG